MRTKSLLLVWCLSACLGMTQTEPKISLGPELLSYPEIAKRMSVGGKRVECVRNLQNSLAVVHLKPRPWSEVRQLLEEGLGVQFRLKETPKEGQEDGKTGKQEDGKTGRQEEGVESAAESKLSYSSSQPTARGLEVWVMERPSETIRVESEQQKRFIDYWLDQANRVENAMFFTRAFSDLPYKEVKEFFKQFEQQREGMSRQMAENMEGFENTASSFTSAMEKFGPDLSKVPPHIMTRLKKMVSDIRGLMKEMMEEEEARLPASEAEEFMKLKDDVFIQMLLLFGGVGMQANASTFLMSRLWEQGLLPEMAREAIRNGISVRTMPLNQVVLRDIPIEDLLSDPVFKSGELTEVRQEHPPYDMLLLSLNLVSMGESLHLQARLSACLPDTFKPIQAFFSVFISFDRRAYSHTMQTDKKVWDEKNKQLQEFLRKGSMQKTFPCERQQTNLVSGVLLAWAKETGSEVIAEYHPLHNPILAGWDWGMAQTMTIDEGEIARMEAEGIEADISSEDPDKPSTAPVPPPAAKPEPPQPPAKQDVSIARAFGERKFYDLHETKNVLIVRNRWRFLHHIWDTPSETVLKLTGGRDREAVHGERVLDEQAFDYDKLYSFYRVVNPLHSALIDAIHLSSFFYSSSSSSVSKLRLAVQILNALTPLERRQLLTEGGTVPLSRLSGAVLSQLIPIMRVNVEEFPHAWHPGFITQLPAWELKLTLSRNARSGTLHVELKAPQKERQAQPVVEEGELSYYRQDVYLGKLKAIQPTQKKSN